MNQAADRPARAWLGTEVLWRPTLWEFNSLGHRDQNTVPIWFGSPGRGLRSHWRHQAAGEGPFHRVRQALAVAGARAAAHCAALQVLIPGRERRPGITD